MSTVQNRIAKSPFTEAFIQTIHGKPPADCAQHQGRNRVCGACIRQRAASEAQHLMRAGIVAAMRSAPAKTIRKAHNPRPATKPKAVQKRHPRRPAVKYTTTHRNGSAAKLK